MMTISKSRSMSASCAASVTSNHLYSKPLGRPGVCRWMYFTAECRTFQLFWVKTKQTNKKSEYWFTMQSFSGFPPSNISPLGSPCSSPPVQGTPASSPTIKICSVQLPEPAGPLTELVPGSVAPKSHHRTLTHSQSAPSSTTTHWRPPSLCGR